jgi:CheY-like chemotaxis protein
MSRVLVLEPDRDVRVLFGRLVRHLGHEPVLHAADGGVDIVLIEPASPPARRILAAVREHRPDLHVICASVYPQEDVPGVAANVFLPKPISLAALEAALTAVTV